MELNIFKLINRTTVKAFIMLSAVVCASTSCGPGNAGAGTQADVPADTAAYTLPMPEIPPSLTSPEERAAFLARHYWDKMNWNDTVLLGSERFMGESMATFGTLLSLTPRDKAVAAISGMVSSAASSDAALHAVNDYAYTYFYYPDSPQYDPELYLFFINALSAQPALDMASRARLDDRREQILKNRVGETAADFAYVDSNGRRRSLLATRTDAPVRILMLYDPDCEVCHEAVKLMTGSENFAQAQDEGSVAVIAINAFGQDGGGPAVRDKDFPAVWTVGYSPDGAVDADELYIIRATPAIYILDSDGRILEKDISMRRLAEIIA